MELIEEFCRQCDLFSINIGLFGDDSLFRKDYTDFVEVDCEKGDYGVIKHYCALTGELIAVEEVSGGVSSFEFTKKGVEELAQTAINVLKLNIINLTTI